ncbi:MAG: VOC family protein [Dehalococcoidia bacterium]
MAVPIVHFEIMGSDLNKTVSFYSSLFGWNIDANNPWNYGMVHNDGKGIDGGIGGGGEAGPPRTTFYAEVDDLQAYLDKAQALGGKVVMPVTEIPGAVTMAMFADPDGNTIGLVKSA